MKYFFSYNQNHPNLNIDLLNCLRCFNINICKLFILETIRYISLIQSLPNREYTSDLLKVLSNPKFYRIYDLKIL